MPLDHVVLRLTLLTVACYVEQVWAGGRDAPGQVQCEREQRAAIHILPRTASLPHHKPRHTGSKALMLIFSQLM